MVIREKEVLIHLTLLHVQSLENKINKNKNRLSYLAES